MKKALFAVLAVALSGLAARRTEAAYASGGREFDFEGHHYWVVYDSASGHDWGTALQYAGSQIKDGMTGYLATITTPQEYIRVQQAMDAAPNNDYWIGGNDSVEEGVWRWAISAAPESGIEFYRVGANPPAQNGNYGGPGVGWYGQEPNNQGDNQNNADCMSYSYSYQNKWRDTACGNNNGNYRGAIVEFGTDCHTWHHLRKNPGGAGLSPDPCYATGFEGLKPVATLQNTRCIHQNSLLYPGAELCSETVCCMPATAPTPTPPTPTPGGSSPTPGNPGLSTGPGVQLEKCQAWFDTLPQGEECPNGLSKRPGTYECDTNPSICSFETCCVAAESQATSCVSISCEAPLYKDPADKISRPCYMNPVTNVYECSLSDCCIDFNAAVGTAGPAAGADDKFVIVAGIMVLVGILGLFAYKQTTTVSMRDDIQNTYLNPVII